MNNTEESYSDFLSSTYRDLIVEEMEGLILNSCEQIIKSSTVKLNEQNMFMIYASPRLIDKWIKSLETCQIKCPFNMVPVPLKCSIKLPQVYSYLLTSHRSHLYLIFYDTHHKKCFSHCFSDDQAKVKKIQKDQLVFTISNDCNQNFYFDSLGSAIDYKLIFEQLFFSIHAKLDIFYCKRYIKNEEIVPNHDSSSILESLNDRLNIVEDILSQN